MESFTKTLIETGTEYGLNLIGGLLILIVGWIVARWAAGLTRRTLAKNKNIDGLLAGFLANLVKYLILVVAIVAMLNRFGIQTASLLAVLGAAGLAIGLALQGTLSNLAAGVMLLIFRPFKLGQFIEVAGHSGTVKSVRLFTTELATGDNRQIILPNAKVWGDAIVNFSYHDTRRVDMVYGIAYGDSIDRAMEIIKAQADADNRSLSEPAPQIVVGELADSSVNIIARVWCEAGDYWGLKFDLTKNIKEAFDAAGISIPFPQQDVHMHQAAA